jgi:aminoglycoside phosphotransferase (APT) family kinase protein
MYTVENIHQQLFTLGLLSRESLLSGGYEATTAHARQEYLTITTRKNENYFIKQADPANAAKTAGLKNEILFYQRIKTNLPELAASLPEVKYGCIDGNQLILAHQPTAVPASRHHKNPAAGGATSAMLQSVGKLLGQLHAKLSANHLRSAAEFDFLGSAQPRTFELQKFFKPHPGILQWAGAGVVQFIELAQAQKTLDRDWENAAQCWNADAIIHGDTRLDHFLIDEQYCTDGTGTGKVTGWEKVQFGDAAWDIAGVLSDLMIRRAEMPGEKTPQQAARHTNSPFIAIAADMQAFCQSYAAACDIEGQALDRRFEKAIAFSGMRIMQTAFDMSAKADPIHDTTLLLVETGAGILKDPQFACGQFCIPRQGADVGREPSELHHAA